MEGSLGMVAGPSEAFSPKQRVPSERNRQIGKIISGVNMMVCSPLQGNNLGSAKGDG